MTCLNWLVSLWEVYCVHRLVKILWQVINKKMLWLVYHEEFTHSTHKFWCAKMFLYIISIQMKQTPFQLNYRVLTRLIPHSHRWSVIIVKQSTHQVNNWNLSYAIEPQVNPTRRYSQSDILRADGAPRSFVSSRTGVSEFRRLHL